MTRVYHRILGWFHQLGTFFIFTHSVIHASRRALFRRSEWDPILGQVWSVTTRSLPTVAFAGIFTGAILVLQFNSMLAQYDAQAFLGGLNTSALVREVGPLMISFILAGKIGAFTAAELGTMKVTEQIEAIECLGTSPLEYLVVPRFLGMIFGSVLLLTLGLIIGMIGSMLVAVLFCGMNPLQYFSGVPRFTGVDALAGGLFRSIVYSTIVAAVSCYEGYRASGGARGVGRAVTQTAISINVSIVFANFATAQFLDAAERVSSWLTELVNLAGRIH